MIGTTIDQYKIVKSLGKDYVSESFLGVHVIDGGEFILKAITPKLFNIPGFKERFLEDSVRMIRFEHPNLVPLVNVLEENERLYTVQERVQARTLTEVIQDGGLGTAASGYPGILRDLLKGMGYAHEQNYVHRNLCPDHVLVLPNGTARITGFEEALQLEVEARIDKNKMVAAARYFSPERFANPATTDIRANIYSLGVILFEMVTGTFPYHGSTFVEVQKQHMEKEVPDPHSINPNVPEPMVTMIRKAMAKKPEERYQTTSEFFQALGPAQNQPVAGQGQPGTRPKNAAFSVRSKADEPPKQTEPGFDLISENELEEDIFANEDGAAPQSGAAPRGRDPFKTVGDPSLEELAALQRMRQNVKKPSQDEEQPPPEDAFNFDFDGDKSPVEAFAAEPSGEDASDQGMEMEIDQSLNDFTFSDDSSANLDLEPPEAFDFDTDPAASMAPNAEAKPSSEDDDEGFNVADHDADSTGHLMAAPAKEEERDTLGAQEPRFDYKQEMAKQEQEGDPDLSGMDFSLNESLSDPSSLDSSGLDFGESSEDQWAESSLDQNDFSFSESDPDEATGFSFEDEAVDAPDFAPEGGFDFGSEDPDLKAAEGEGFRFDDAEGGGIPAMMDPPPEGAAPAAEEGGFDLGGDDMDFADGEFAPDAGMDEAAPSPSAEEKRTANYGEFDFDEGAAGDAEPENFDFDPGPVEDESPFAPPPGDSGAVSDAFPTGETPLAEETVNITQSDSDLKGLVKEEPKPSPPKQPPQVEMPAPDPDETPLLRDGDPPVLPPARSKKGLADSIAKIERQNASGASKKGNRGIAAKKPKRVDVKIMALTAVLALALGTVFFTWFRSQQTKKREDRVMQEIQQLVGVKKYDEALDKVAAHLAEDPSKGLRKRLGKLKETIQKESEEIDQQIATLMTRAEELQTAGKEFVDGKNDALGTYMEVLSLQPNTEKASTAAGDIKQRQLEKVESLLKGNQDIQALNILAGLVKADRGDKKIRAQYQGLKEKLQQEKSGALQDRIQTLFQKQQYEPIVALLGELAQITPQSPFVKDMRQSLVQSFLKKGQDARGVNNFALAERYYRHVLEIDPQNNKANKAIGQLEEERLKLRIAQTTRSLERAVISKNLKKQYSLANELLRLDPGNHGANNALNEVNQAVAVLRKEAGNMRDLGQYQEAAKLYKQIYDIDGDSQTLADWKKFERWSPPPRMSFVPVGTFKMGSFEEANTRPIHQVFISNFFIDQYEVTNKEFYDFVRAKPQWSPSRIEARYHDGNYLKHWERGRPKADDMNRPVSNVSWYAARAYAQSVGKRLPSEAEWEKAAAANTTEQKYWWGNYSDAKKAVYEFYPEKKPAPVGSFPANGYGIHEILGNVNEWVEDTYSETFYRQSEGARDPVNLEPGGAKVFRGGSYRSMGKELALYLRYYQDPRFCHETLGFRCVQDATLAP